jgi:hypothetical protein
MAVDYYFNLALPCTAQMIQGSVKNRTICTVRASPAECVVRIILLLRLIFAKVMAFEVTLV